MITEQDSSLEDALHSPRSCCSSHWTGLVPIADTSVASSATQTWGHGLSLAFPTVLRQRERQRQREALVVPTQPLALAVQGDAKDS